MQNKTHDHLYAAAVISFTAIAAFFLGLAIGCQTNNAVTPNEQPIAVASEAIDSLPPGVTIKYELIERNTPSTEKHQGGAVNVGADKSFWRGLSWFGLGGPEAAAKDQGLNIDGKAISAGQMHGYGWAEQLWARIKSLFWFLTFAGVALVVLMFIPVTAPIAGAIWRGIASIIPVFGSITEAARARIKLRKPLIEVIEGGQAFKKLLEKDTVLKLTQEQKDGVVDLFRAAQVGAQDNGTQAAVNAIKR